MDDAEWVISLAINRLLHLLRDDGLPMAVKPQLRDQVQEATDQLNLFRQTLQDTRGNNSSATVPQPGQQWMVQLLRAIYSAEDATDTFLVKTALQMQGQRQSRSRKIRWAFSRLAYSHSQNKFGDEMSRLVVGIRDLPRDQEIFGNNSDASSSSSTIDQRPHDQQGQQQQQQQQQQPWNRVSGFSSSSYQETEAVGLDRKAEELVARVMDSHQVIAVVGGIGSGKTVLAKAVYNRLDIRQQHFERFAWVRAPEEFKASEFFSSVVRQLEMFSKVAESEEELMYRLRRLSHDKRCLIVVDDVRTTKLLEVLRENLLTGNTERNVKVVITTRNPDIAAQADALLEVPTLTNEDCWALFLKKACIAAEDSLMNSDMIINLKEQILELRDRSPLAISLLGGLLSANGLSHSEWTRVITRANTGGSILALIYQELPPVIKPLFLYLALFPRGFEIPVRRLLRLWFAEGLVSPSPEQLDLEGTAEIHLEELISRHLIEVVKWKTDGSPKTCTLPSALHDHFSQMAGEIGFFHVHETSSSSSAEGPQFPVRRLASHSGMKNYPRTPDLSKQHIVSFVYLNTRGGGIPSGEVGTFLSWIVSKRNFGLLRLLDLEGVYKPWLPKALAKLLDLRYLGLRSTMLDAIPDCVGDLLYLESLDLKHTMITILPSSIWKNTNLQHLYMTENRSNPPLQDPSVGSLTNLQTLWGVCIGNETPIEEGLNQLLGIKKLGVTCQSITMADALADWISQLTGLQSLRLRAVNESGQPSSLRLGSLMNHDQLSNLYLLGVLDGGIDVHLLPPNLKVLTLSLTHLNDDPLPILGRLPKLKTLKLLGNSYTGSYMICPPGGFPELHVLKLWKMEELRTWTVEEGGMPCLREMEIRCCRNLEQLEGLQRVTSLKKLIIHTYNFGFIRNVEESVGNDVVISSYEPSSGY